MKSIVLKNNILVNLKFKVIILSFKVVVVKLVKKGFYCDVLVKCYGILIGSIELIIFMIVGLVEC